MIAAGDIVLFRFPQTDLRIGKLRPALLLKELPGGLDDWLVCMISSQMHQEIPGLDLVLLPNDPDFADTGLKCASLFRLSRLAVVDKRVFEGKLGKVNSAFMQLTQQRLADWIRTA
jgi:mRNA interferase MazF